MSGYRRFTVKVGSVYDTEGSAGTATLPSGDFTNAMWLEPVYMSDGSNGEIAEARITSNLLPEDGYSMLSWSQQIRIVDNGATAPASSSGSESQSPSEDATVVFNGIVVKKVINISGAETRLEFICYSLADDFLRRKKLHGQKRRSASLEQSWFTSGDEDGAQGISLSGDADINTIDTPLIFNPGGQPNMTKQSYFVSGDDSGSGGDADANSFRLFEAPFRNQINSSNDSIVAVPWTLKEAIKYILNFFNGDWAIDKAGFSDAALDAVFGGDSSSGGGGASGGSGSGDTGPYGNPVIAEVNLEGASLAEALDKLLEPYNYLFNVEPDPQPGNKHTIKFWYRGSGTATTARLSPRGTSAHSSNANMVNGELVVDTTPVINSTEAYGAPISATTLAHTSPPSPSDGAPPVMKLIKGWADADLTFAYQQDGTTVNSFDQNFRKKYCQPDLIAGYDNGADSGGSGGGETSGGSGGSGGGGSHLPYGVGRLWIVNQGQVPSANIEDLSTDLYSDYPGSNSVDLRRLEKPQIYTQNSAGGFLTQSDIVVEMSTDGGSTWGIIAPSWYRVITEGMGIVFTPQNLEKLGVMIPNADVLSGKNYWQSLSDSTLQIRILCSVKSDERVAAKKPNVGASVPLANERQIENSGYREFDFNPLINDALYYTTYQPQQPNVDDSSKLLSMLDQATFLTDRIMISGKIVVLLDAVGTYRPGFVVTEIENRDIPLDPAPTILRTVYHFQERMVDIILDNRKIKTVVRAKPMTGDTMREHQLGVETLTRIQGHHVKSLPGDINSIRQQAEAGETF